MFQVQLIHHQDAIFIQDVNAVMKNVKTNSQSFRWEKMVVSWRVGLLIN